MPTPQDVHIDTALTNVAIGYRNRGYIADKIFPRVAVAKQSDRYYKYPKGAWFRDEASIRAPRTQSRQATYPLSNEQYFANEYALHTLVADEERKNADTPLAPDQKAVQFVMDKIDLRIERLVATLILTAANWAGGHSEDAAGGWAAGASNTFIEDVETRIETIRKASGLRPNVLVLDAVTMSQLKREATVLSRIQYVERGIVTADLLASMFNLDRVLIGDAIYSDAQEKADGTDFNAVDIWETNAGKGSAALLYAAPAPSIDVPSAGYIFGWTSGDDMEEVGIKSSRGVRRWREAGKHSDAIESFDRVDAKMTGSDLGFLWYDTHTT